MKFVMSNKKEILAVLNETEKKIEEIRFLLTQLPQEFEFTAIEKEDATGEIELPAPHSETPHLGFR